MSITPPAPTFFNGVTTASNNIQPQLYPNAADVAKPQHSSPSPSATSSSVIMVIIIIASAIIVSASIYLLLRFLSRRFHRSFRTFSAADDVVSSRNNNNDNNNNIDIRCLNNDNTSTQLLDSLPLFTFASLTGSVAGGDCAVCLSKFERRDQLRLLPLCCHAFHAECIDTWLVSNLTCPLCRSSVQPTEADIMNKIISASSQGNGISNRNGSGSFRIEIGSVSRRQGPLDSSRRSYSIGSFEYVVDDGYEVSVGSTHQRGASECTSVDKESLPEPPGETVASEVAGGGGRNWLREYVDRVSFSLSSRTASFRGSGRFFTGSSRRNEVVVPVDDIEANRMGEEISELFRWLSGV